MIIQIEKRRLKEIIEFLNKSRVILHPVISPSGIPDFTNYQNRTFFLILDRNILVLILDLVQKGTLKDPYKLKLVSSLLFWCDINGISLTSGLAFMEHSHVQGNDLESIKQHNIFQSIYNQYTPQDWLDLASEKKTAIPILKNVLKEKAEYLVYNEHQILQYLCLLKLCQIYFIKGLSSREKIAEFHRWSYENTLIGIYPTVYAIMFFSSGTKLSKELEKLEINELLEKCKNVAWDLTYLSSWSTLFWDDHNEEEVFLFATRDNEIKNLFDLVHSDYEMSFQKALGKLEGERVKKDLESIYVQRPKRTFVKDELNHKVVFEENNLKNLIKKKAI